MSTLYNRYIYIYIYRLFRVSYKFKVQRMSTLNKSLSLSLSLSLEVCVPRDVCPLSERPIWLGEDDSQYRQALGRWLFGPW